MPLSRPASAAFSSASRSAGTGASSPGRQSDVSRIAFRPASWAIVIFAFAATSVACFGLSSAAPTCSDGPPAYAEGAKASAASTIRTPFTRPP
jgi:hypothetical protein